MPIMLDAVVPWGRSYAEYCDMFMLQSHDLGKTILGCGDGPAAFNATWSRRGGKVVSVDPIYAFSGEQIAQRIQETSHQILDQVRLNLADYHWDSITSPEDLLARRRQAMSDFLEDYPHGLVQQRYVAAELPELGLPDDSFDLALCSHLLFLYSKQLSGAFHLQSLTELLRIAREVRIYPLISLEAKHLALAQPRNPAFQGPRLHGGNTPGALPVPARCRQHAEYLQTRAHLRWPPMTLAEVKAELGLNDY